MSTRTVERIDDWDSVPFSGGYAGLRALSDDDFSGVVISGPARLFMLNGTVVGVLDGSIEDFEDADGTAREAPHESLPLLAVMQERSDEVRAKYYTEDTPIEEVSSTLESGGFTGYVELSENVLSGDYYLVYHQGRSMSVAFVGQAERLLTDDEAFERANDEVGIYEVRPAEIELEEIPEPEGGTGAAGGAVDDAGAAGEGATERPTAATDDGEDAAATAETASGDEDTTDQGAADETTADKRTTDEGTEAAASSGSATTEDGTGGEAATGDTAADDAGRSPGESRSAASADTGTESRSTQTAESTTDAHSDTSGRSDHVRQDTTRTGTSTAGDDGDARSGADREPRGSQPTGTESETRTGGDAGSAASPDQLETRSIPSLDPSRTEAVGTPAGSDTAARAAQSGGGGRSHQSGSATGSGQSHSRSSRSSSGAAEQPEPTGHDESGQSDRSQSREQTSQQSGPETAALETELQERREEVQQLEDELADLREDRDDLREERDDLREERDELREERDRLQSELEEARSEIERLEQRIEEIGAESDAGGGTTLSAREAIDGTNLFVRYESKGDATLETAHEGSVDRSTVADNVRLEHHTQFDAAEAVVAGEPYAEFLTGTIQYRFVDWLIGDLLYEIRDTGHEDALRDLYDALPKVDRAELNGEVSVTYVEDGNEQRTQEQFDVVVRDRMGNPLFVANLNDSRQPVTGSMMTELVTSAERLGKSSDTLAGAFLVTSSFFEPEALETAEEATSSGLLSRNKRKSFVNLSRTDGYHLCLVEARNREFHLAVPEL